MYTCLHIHTYIHIYVYTCIYIYVYIYIYIYIHVHTYMCVCVCVCVCVYMYACMDGWMDVRRMYIHRLIYTHIHTDAPPPPPPGRQPPVRVSICTFVLAKQGACFLPLVSLLLLAATRLCESVFVLLYSQSKARQCLCFCTSTFVRGLTLLGVLQRVLQPATDTLCSTAYSRVRAAAHL